MNTTQVINLTQHFTKILYTAVTASVHSRLRAVARENLVTGLDALRTEILLIFDRVGCVTDHTEEGLFK